MPRYQISIAVDDFTAVVYGSAQTGSLANIEHGVSQAIDMLVKPGVFVDGGCWTGVAAVQVEFVVDISG